MDDDLDALLDSALDTMEAQDEVLAREKQAQEAVAQSLINETLSAGGGAVGAGAGPMGGMDAEMLKALSGLMGILQKGPEAMENASEEEMAGITAQLQSTLDQLKAHPSLSEEDATQLKGMKDMMAQLNALEKGQSGAEGETPLSEEEFNARKVELTKMLEAMGAEGGLMGGAGGGGPGLPPFPFPSMGEPAATGAKPSTAAAANASGFPLPPLPEGAANTNINTNTTAPSTCTSEEDACRQVFELTLGILQDKELSKPFMKLKEAYGPWLAANAATLPADEVARFENQYRVASEMCSFFETTDISEVLKEGSTATTEERAAVLERFGTLMAELHSYGEAPPTLFPPPAEGEGEGEAEEEAAVVPETCSS